MLERVGAADQRIIAHLGYARAVAARSLDPRCRGTEREDLIAWGLVGLVQAARRYRADRGATFGSYAARRVRGQVLDALRERDPLTRTARRSYRAAREADPDLPPPFVEVSLDRCVASGREPATLPAPRPARDRRWPAVARELRSLPAVQRRVLVLSYGRGLTLREIGKHIGLSESGVCRIRSRAIRELRRRLAA